MNDYDLKGKYVDMADTNVFVRNGLHTPIISDEAGLEEPRKDEDASSAWKILKIIIFVICVIVFIHQTVSFCKLYYTYPTSASTIVTRPNSFKLPAVTFCSDNPISRSIFCSNHLKLCADESGEEAPCEDKKVPNFGYCADSEKEFPLEDIRKHLCTRKSLKAEDWAVCNSTMEILAWNISKGESELAVTYVEDPESKTFLTCLSTNLRLTDRNETKTWPVDSSTQNAVIDSYKIKVDKTEALYPWAEPQIFLSVHSPLVPVNPLLEGTPLKTGHSYVIRVRLEEERLLAEPYQTNCVDYEDMWRKNNMTGPRSQEMCRDMCLWFSTSNSPLRMVVREYSSDAYKEMYGHWNSTDECMQNCSADCKKLKYSYSIFERKSSLRPAVDGQVSLGNDEISVEISIADPWVAVTIHEPLYSVGHLLSHVGGLLALWIGISVWALVGLMEKATRKIMVWMQ